KIAMVTSASHVLVISDDPAAITRIRAALGERVEYRTIWTRDLSAGLARLGEAGIGVILLDLYLPDSPGLATFERIFAAAHRVPILVLEGGDDEDVARQAVQRGAKDRVLKEHIDQYSFPLVLRHIL